MRTLLALLSICIASGALAHDAKNPKLDQWYEGLQRPGYDGHSPHGYSGTQSCCSKQDCHTTDAELRNGKWFARLGLPHDKDGARTWELQDFKEIPDELIVRGPNGNPVRNEAGEAVICHSWAIVGTHVEVDKSVVYCFIPGTEG